MTKPHDPPRRSVLGINRRNLDLVFADYRPGGFRDLDDKLRSKRLLEAAGLATPTTLGVIESHAAASELPRMLEPLNEVVIKPANGSGGKGILVLQREGQHWFQPGGLRFSNSDLVRHVGDILSGVFSLEEHDDVALLEERIHPHPFLKQLAPAGLPDLRVVLQGRRPVQAMWRLPTEASDGKANLHGGGVGLGVDLETGVTQAASVQGQPAHRHPDTDVELVGLAVPLWPECLTLARHAAELVDVDYLGVDIILDATRGPLILELNARPGLEIQVANAQPQPVSTHRELDRFDRFTFACCWVLLATLGLSPLSYEIWQRSARADLTTLVHRGLEEAAAEVHDAATPGVDWDGEEFSLSEVNTTFAQARAATAARDTALALSLYAQAAADTSIAPFALNNIALLHRHQGDLAAAQEALGHAVTTYPTYARGHYNLGLVLLDQGQPERALEAFQRALEIRPNHAGSWAKVGDILRKRNQLDEAVAAYEEAIRYNPVTSSVRMRLGLAHRALDQYAQANTRFREVLQLKGESESAAYWWARSLLDMRLQNVQVTAGAQDSVLAALKPFENKNGSDRCRSVRARLQWTAGKVSSAHRAFSSLADAGYRRSFHRKAAAVAAIELGLWERASVHLGRLSGTDDVFLQAATELVTRGRSLDVMASRLQAQPARPRETTAKVASRMPLARLLEESSWMPESLRLWSAFVTGNAENTQRVQILDSLEQTQPDFLPLVRWRLRQAASGNDLRAGKRWARRIRRLDHDDPTACLELIPLALAAGDHAAARSVLEDLSRTERASTEIVVLEAEILRAEGELTAARRTLRNLLKRSPDHIAGWILLGEVESSAKRARAATEALRTALQLDPSHRKARETLARQLTRSRDYLAALAQWQRLLSLSPEDVSAHFNTALCLQRLKRPEEAIEYYDRTIVLDENKYQALYNRGLAQLQVGQTSAARRDFERVLEIRPEHAGSLDKLKIMTGATR